MASLTIPNIFTAGTPALASEVNANFTEITNWSQNIDTSNFPIGGFTGGLIFTMANDNAIRIQNNGNDESIKITQGALLGAGKASILIYDHQTQTNLGSAELRMDLVSGATIPSIWVTHSSVDTFKLTKTALDIGSAVTTTFGGPLVLSNPSVTGNLSLTGKETINRTSTNQFLELANTTTSKSLTVTPQTASFDLNINDTTSAYNFKINGVTKTVIDNNGLDGSYLKASSVSISALNGAVPAVNRSPNTPTIVSNITATINTGGNTAVVITGATLTITTSAANKSVLLQFFGQDTDSYLTTVTTNDVCQVYIYGSGPGGWTGIVCSKYINEETSEAGNEDSRAEFGLNMSAFIPLTTQGTYTFDVYYRTPVFPGGTITVNKYKFQAIELG